MERITYEDLRQLCIQYLEDYEAVFNNVCEELDSYSGFLNDDRYYRMEEFDELLCGKSPLDIAQLVYQEDFNPNDNYFKFTITGVVSSDFKDYTDYYSASEVLDAVLDNLYSIYIDDDSFKAMCEALDEEYDYYDIDVENDEYEGVDEDE